MSMIGSLRTQEIANRRAPGRARNQTDVPALDRGTVFLASSFGSALGKATTDKLVLKPWLFVAISTDTGEKSVSVSRLVGTNP